jgi:predicted PurR-regulated permease PerM
MISADGYILPAENPDPHNSQETLMIHSLRRPTAVLLSLLLALMPMLPAQAAMIGNEQIINQSQSQQTRGSLQQLFEQDTARQQLQAWGVNPEQIQNRIDSLTDSELARINQQVDTLDAGGNVLGILLIIFIVFVITDVLGATDIFPFIHPVN